MSSESYKSYTNSMLSFVKMAGLVCVIVILLIIAIVLPIYLVWQGEWSGILGLALYITLLSFGKIIK